MTGQDDKRPNFFLLLGLDPNASWDQALFTREFAQHRASWTKASTGLGRRAQEAKKNLFLAKKIEQLMRDPTLREQERDQASQLQEAGRIARRRDLNDRLDVLLARGFLLDEEVSKLREDFAEALESSPELRQRLDAASVREAKPADEASLAPSVETELLNNLSGVGAKSLYDVLRDIDQAITDTSPRELLLAAADQLADRAHKIKDKRDPKVLHWERLSRLARVVFGTEEERRRHDVSMRRAQLRFLVSTFEEALSVAREMTAGQVELFLRRAREQGIDDLDDARSYLVAYFQTRKWPVQLPAEESQRQIARLIQCVYCHELNQPNERACRTCAEDLQIPCPNCGQVEPRYGGGCRCGFPIGQRMLVESLLVEVRSATERLDFAQAGLHLERAERIWRLPPGRSDDLTVSILAARGALDETQRQVTTMVATVERLIMGRQFVAAEQRLRAASEGLPRRDQLLKQAGRAVAQARKLYQRARHPDLPAATRAELYAEALRICDDFEPARSELQQIPPEPPSQVVALVDSPAVGVRLTWRPAPEPDVSYLVVRGTATRAPRHPEDLPDQQRLTTTTETTWWDRTATELPGQTLWYAVFTERRGTFSTPAVAAPVLVAADAADVRATAQDSAVVLTWRAPKHAARVEVRRTPLDSGADGAVLTGFAAGRAVDIEVHKGVRYRYTVRVAYRDASGALWWSPGVHQDITPVERPALPGPLTVTAKPTITGMYRHRVQLRWPAADAGAVRVVRQAGAGWLREGEVVAEKVLGRDGRILADGEDDIWIDSQFDVCSYFPVLLLENLGYVGRARRYAHVDEPTDVEGEFGGGSVRLGWRWPDGAVAALVGHDAVALPVDPTTAPGQLMVNRVGAELYGGLELPDGGDERYALVATVIRRDGLEFVTSGVPVSVRRPAVRVEYAVRHPALRRPELILWAERPTALPSLVLVSRLGRAPHTRADGTEVMKVPERTVRGQQTLALPRSTGDEPQYRLFTATTSDSVAVELAQRPAVSA
ncbi:hypothetical protein Vqi01_21650 [Micromonospora qiuiae]|uniref:SaeA second Fn3-like domain-containing protein n=1 Tax=Micromonospora qiuiae TaxID=502268 RepID=A0ABQ4JA83_9ACTN|nr:hypothetical protein [Micromonospora qiuiae]GIJ27003.1 hypothetical protein Vqi01_21650 [Micromonospora qiuiae]